MNESSSEETRAAFERAQRLLVAEGTDPGLALEEGARIAGEIVQDLNLSRDQLRVLLRRISFTLNAATYFADLFASAVEEKTGESRLDWMYEHDAQVDRFVERMARLSGESS